MEVEDAEEEKAEGAHPEEAPDDIGDGQIPVAEDAEPDERRPRPALPEHERTHEDRRPAEGADGGGRYPAVLVDGHQSVDGQHGRQRDEDGATDVGALSDPQADVVLHPGPTTHQGHDPDGQVDEEDPVPVQRLDHGTAEEQPDRPARDDDEGVDGHGPDPLTRVGKERGDQAEAGRRDHGGADALHEATRHQLALARREPAQQRGRRKEDQPGQQDPFAPEQVPHPSPEEQEPAEGDQVGIDDPGQPGGVEGQIALDGGQGHVHHRVVDDHHHRAHTQDHQDQATSGHDGLVHLVRLVRMVHLAGLVRR